MLQKIPISLYQLIERLHQKKIDATGLAIFRITYCLVLFGEVLQFYYFRHLIFDNIPYIEEGAIDPTIPLILWLTCILFIIFGLFTTFSSFINYIFSLIFFGAINSYEYHMFYAYMGINFLLIFLPVSRCFSLDRLREKLKYSNTRFQYQPPKTVSVLAYYLPLLVGIGFVYFDSIFFKITSNYWMQGLGMWVPASLPMFTHVENSFFLNQEWLSKALGYITLLFEAIFIFLFWFKKFRVPLLIIGLGLHLGILLEFPIPFFALGAISIYLLMVPVNLWKKLTFKPSSSPLLKVYYDIECPLCARTKIVIEHLDVRKKVQFLSVQAYAAHEPVLAGKDMDVLLSDIHSVSKKGRLFTGIDTYINIFNAIFYLKPLNWLLRMPGVYQIGRKIYAHIAVNRTTERCTEENCGYTPPLLPTADNKMKLLENFTLADLKVTNITLGVLVLILLQINTTYNAAFFLNLRASIGVEKNIVGKAIGFASYKLTDISKTLLGITSHSVFMDAHFNDYNHIVAITYKSQNGTSSFLPIITADGAPSRYIYGPNWVKWTFRVNSPNIDMHLLTEGIKDFTAFWAHKNNIDLSDATFEILVKKIDIPLKWEENFLNKQIQNPWTRAGEVKWEDNQFKVIKCISIESM